MVQALVVGFDAMDRDVARRLVDAGRMPHLARLMREGTVAEMANPEGMLTLPVWPCIASGVHPTRNGRLAWRVLRPGTYRVQQLGLYSRLSVPTFWERLLAEGRSCTVADFPVLVTEPHPSLVALREWHAHDRRGPIEGSPPSVVREVATRFAADDVDLCDRRGADGDLAALQRELSSGLDRFCDGLSWLLAEHTADVVVAVFGSAHCAGHQFWHLHDPTSRRHDPALVEELGDVLAHTYERLDAALGRLVAEAEPEVATMVILSHGMSEDFVMPHLLTPVANAIDDAWGRPHAVVVLREWLRRFPSRARRALRRRLRGQLECDADEFVDGSRRWFELESFPTHGALRLNVRGREPRGRVPRGEVDATLDRLEQELLALRDEATGDPVVERVIRVSTLYGDIDHTPLPDLIVEWRGSSVVEGVTSPTIGTVRRRWGETRTGAHEQDGLVVLHGPAIPGGVGEMRSVDVWPTLASVLGVPAGDVDGEPLAALRPSSARAES